MEKPPPSSFFTLHSTPLALWRGVGGEAFSFFTLQSSFLIASSHIVFHILVVLEGLGSFEVDFINLRSGGRMSENVESLIAKLYKPCGT
jgi:hypothetical protein